MAPIKLTERAIEKAHELRCNKAEWHGLSLRLYLDGKGCDGFFYGVTFDKPSDTDLHFRQIWNKQLLDVVVDPETLRFVQGSIVEWVDDERGAGFLVENPKHRQFRGKFFKRKIWQERLTT